MSRRALTVALLATALATLASAGSTAGSNTTVPTPREISIDPSTDPESQHATAVEPDSFSFGNNVVAVFQSGRFSTGGASQIGFATSHDGGQTWASGLLPLPVRPAGPLTLVSDPAVAYDRVHAVWVTSILGGRSVGTGDDRRIFTSLYANHSSDGISWTTATVQPDRVTASYDKNWIACDNGAASPRAGRCYTFWTGFSGDQTVAGLSTSDDGGVTWSAPKLFEQIHGFGVYPLVRPDGTLVLVFATGEGGAARIEAVRSTDGGASFGQPSLVAHLRTKQIANLRVPALHSGELAADGHLFVAWQDCRYRAGCRSNDILYSSSADGRSWSRPLRVPTGSALAGLDHVLPGLAVQPVVNRRGSSAGPWLALTFYALSPAGCAGEACSFTPYFVSSPNGGRYWSAVEQLGAPAPAAWFPLAGARFAGDYISTSIADNAAVPVFAWASAAPDPRFHQGIYATAIPPLPGTPAVRLGRPFVRTKPHLTVRASIAPTEAAHVTCSASVGRRPLKLASARISGGTAICSWKQRPRGRVTGSIAVVAPEGTANRGFVARAT